MITFTNNVNANEPVCDVNDVLDETCTEIGDLNFSIALGYGVKQNPYFYRDDIPLIALVDVNIYWQRWFLDGDTLGYTWHDSENHTLNIIGRFNEDSAYLHDWHISNFTSPQVSSGNSTPLNNDRFSDVINVESGQDKSIEISPPNFDVSVPNTPDSGSPTEPTTPAPQVPVADSPQQPENSHSFVDVKRKASYHFGFEYRYHVGNGSLRSQVVYDISQIHKGFGVLVEWQNTNTFGDWLFISKLGAQYKSGKWLDYYYGVDATETNLQNWLYKASAGVNAHAELTAVYKLKENWSLLNSLRVQKLSSQVSDSPLVDKSSLVRWFTGVAYHF
ncbi:MipA/OmpV family protein [Saccharobesus litoralis]|uniref:MipA/OmpV family protein n=1 Tax=Saccharobesus litoralis TaxID=2172099 RepID=UPI00131EE368|nr:MipA/OmpV family protein [Saccharobesus litoralis]